MEFHVSLIKTQRIWKLSGPNVFELCNNATFIADDSSHCYWCFEGETDALDVEVEEVAHGIVSDIPESHKPNFLEYFGEVFCFDFKGMKRSFEI